MAIAKRELGRTGLQVTTLGYGAMELRGAPRARDITEEQAETVLGAFFAVGYATSVIALSAVGLFVRQELTFGLLLLPGIGIGYATEPLVGRFVDRRRFRIAILTISGASAIALALR